ncbi:unnamed protein product [Phytophthora lilii]|uniref:Unnamed protein product n=1 Tax=Phytophthora lilii TaxID=2077276 RepID=A0A9W7CR24_9STRA|nr:unnamed protein product [Phytophthora lilii]
MNEEDAVRAAGHDTFYCHDPLLSCFVQVLRFGPELTCSNRRPGLNKNFGRGTFDGSVVSPAEFGVGRRPMWNAVAPKAPCRRFFHFQSSAPASAGAQLSKVDGEGRDVAWRPIALRKSPFPSQLGPGMSKVTGHTSSWLKSAHTVWRISVGPKR